MTPFIPSFLYRLQRHEALQGEKILLQPVVLVSAPSGVTGLYWEPVFAKISFTIPRVLWIA